MSREVINGNVGENRDRGGNGNGIRGKKAS
jgi:hypothetical protein